MYFEGVFLKLLQVDLFTKRGSLRTFGSCDENVFDEIYIIDT